MDIGAVEKINSELMRCKDRLKYLRACVGGIDQVKNYDDFIEYELNEKTLKWYPKNLRAEMGESVYNKICGESTDDNGVYEEVDRDEYARLCSFSPVTFKELSDSLDFGKRLRVSFDVDGSLKTYVFHTKAAPLEITSNSKTLTWYPGSLSVIYQGYRYPFIGFGFHPEHFKITDETKGNLRRAKPESFMVYGEEIFLYFLFKNSSLVNGKTFLFRKDSPPGYITERS
jgi:hypothetical protein